MGDHEELARLQTLEGLQGVHADGALPAFQPGASLVDGDSGDTCDIPGLGIYVTYPVRGGGKGKLVANDLLLVGHLLVDPLADLSGIAQIGPIRR